MSDSVDWHRLLWDLLQRGWTLRGIGERIGLPFTTVRGYLQGSHPAHWKGELLIRLWSEETGNSAEEAQRSEALTMRPVGIVRSAVHHSESVAASLAQLDFGWHGAARAESSQKAAPLATSTRYRVGLALTPWDDKPVSAFVVHDADMASRVQGAPMFLRWLTEWCTAGTSDVLDCAQPAARPSAPSRHLEPDAWPADR